VADTQVSKSQFKARALEYFRQVEADGASIVVTDHGEATIEVRRYRAPKRDPLAILRGTALAYAQPTEPVDADEWESAR
jgi:antitoxin (DNA-binding transcriptional repressor) of toxin-antitoxin stability system